MEPGHPDTISATAALEAFDAEKLKDAERRFEEALHDLQTLGAEPAMIRQSELAFDLYKALHAVRASAGYEQSETENYKEVSGGSVDWGPGDFAKWMGETHDLLESFRGTIANPDGL
jgi:hypothetical protein